MPSRPLITTGLLAAVITVCGGCTDSPVAPVVPKTVSPPPAGPTVTRYSVIYVGVSDILNRGVGAGAVVTIVDGPGKGTTSTTDQFGTASFAGSFDAGIPITLEGSKNGLVGTVTFTPPSVGPTCSPSTLSCSSPWAWLYLDAPENVAIELGDYDVTFQIGDDCTGLSADLRKRSYPATIGHFDRLASHYRVQLTGDFLDPIGWNPAPGAFNIFAFGHDVGIPNMDGDTGPVMVESLTPNATLTIDLSGFPMSSAAGPSVSSFTLPLQWVGLYYCETKDLNGGWGDCNYASRVVRHDTCVSHNGQLVFKRR